MFPLIYLIFALSDVILIVYIYKSIINAIKKLHDPANFYFNTLIDKNEQDMCINRYMSILKKNIYNFKNIIKPLVADETYTDICVNLYADQYLNTIRMEITKDMNNSPSPIFRYNMTEHIIRGCDNMCSKINRRLAQMNITVKYRFKCHVDKDGIEIKKYYIEPIDTDSNMIKLYKVVLDNNLVFHLISDEDMSEPKNYFYRYLKYDILTNKDIISEINENIIDGHERTYIKINYNKSIPCNRMTNPNTQMLQDIIKMYD
jgi:hypothetical protein